MVSLKELYQQRRNLFELNQSLRSRVLKKIRSRGLKKKFSKFFPSKRRRLLKKRRQGILYVKSTFTNTFVALTNLRGKVIFVQSAGSCGFQGKKKRSTKFAIQWTLNRVVEAAKDQRFQEVFFCVKGFSRARYYVLKYLKKNMIKVLGIRDVTPNPHNGCRPRKLRRV